MEEKGSDQRDYEYKLVEYTRIKGWKAECGRKFCKPSS